MRSTLLDKAAVEGLIKTRRDIHRFPELAFAEHRTAALAADRLRAVGIEVTEGVGGTGVVGTLRGVRPGPVLLLRAELDALPLHEDTDVPFRSEIDGAMHACGHDAHVAILLAVADALAARRADLPGTVRFAFQPAEEVGEGAPAMLDDGLFDDPPVDMAIGQHMHAHLPAGTVGVCTGAAAASASRFAIELHGRGGHGAFPEASVDPVVAAAHLVTALYTIVSREVSSAERAVLSVCTLDAGTAFNIIPEAARLGGTIRAANPDVHERIARRAAELTEGISRSFRCTSAFEHTEMCPLVVNDPHVSDTVKAAAARVAGADKVLVPQAVMASDDVAFFLRRVPGCYMFLGAAYTDGRPQTPHHSNIWDIDESALPLGAEVLLASALDCLERGRA